MPNKKFYKELTLVIGYKIVEALQYLQRVNIIHDNINCENIILLCDDMDIITGVNFIDLDEYNVTIKAGEYKTLNGANFKNFDGHNEIISTGINFVNFYEHDELITPDFFGNTDLESNNEECIISAIKDLGHVLIEMCGEITANYWVNENFVGKIKLDALNSFQIKFSKLKSSTISVNKGSILNIDKVFSVLYNRPLTIGSIPNSVTSLTLSSFNQIITIGSIPNSVINLDLPSFNQAISIGSIPNSVTKLTLSSFNLPIINGSIPDSVTDLKLTSNQPITIGTIPENVEYLTLSSFNQPILIGPIPENVKCLTLSSFNQIITIGSIPNSVTKLKLSSFNKPIIHGSIPDSVTDLTLSSFNKPISIGSIPENVKYLTLSSFNQSVSNIPKTVIKLILGNIFGEIESLSNLWISRLEFININVKDKLPIIVGSINPSIKSLIINKEEKIPKLIGNNSGLTYGPLLFLDDIKLEHLENEWNIIKIIDQNKIIARKKEGTINNTSVFECIIKEVNYEEYCTLYRLKDCTLTTKYYGIGKNGNRLYLYLEYIPEAISITDQLKSQPIGQKMKDDDIISLAIEISKAIEIIHSNQIIHGNINCDNILLIPNENNKSIKINGFDQSLIFNNCYNPFFNRLIGKETHMAPEVKLIYNLASYKSDIWSLGCTLIEMAGGNLKQLDNNGIPIIPDNLSNYLRNIIQRCLIINQNGRFSAKQLHRYLNNKQKEYKKFYSFKQPITYESMRSIPYESITNLELTDFNDELTPLLIPRSVKSLSLPSFNRILLSGSIPSTVTHLSFKIFNSKIQENSIPLSTTYLDFGDFDIQNYIIDGIIYSLPILTLRCGFKFTKIINLKLFPQSVTDLQLHNYNLPLVSNCIPPNVTYLTLGDDFTDFKSLSSLPSSIVNLKFNTSSSTELIKDIPDIIKGKSITSLMVNGKNIETIIFLNTNFNSNSEIPLPDLLIHNKLEWDDKSMSRLGKGGFGSVFKAKKLNGILNGVPIEECAIKFIKKSKFRRNEIDILQLLNDNIYSIKYYGSGIDEFGNIYIYMEYNNKSISIADKLKEKPSQRFEENEIISFGIEIVTALHCIHQQHNIIHRDIKCSNILLINDGKRIGIKFIDYGLSMQIDKDRYYSFKGTETHLAPEVKLQNAKVSFKSDIFSIGCTLIEMAGGNLEDRDKKDVNLIIPDHLSPYLRNIIQRCIVSNFNSRLDSKELINLLSCGNIIFNNSDDKDEAKQFILPTFDEPLTIDSIVDKSIIQLSLPSFNNESIEIGSIPSTVTHLSFKIFNQEIQVDSIPSSVTYLDLGDEFDIQNNGDNIPDETILTLKCGYKFTKVLSQRSIPQSVTDLILHNYNLPLASNSIASNVSYLTLGNDFTDFKSLSNLPSSIINLKFGTHSIIDQDINTLLKPSITSLIINGVENIKNVTEIINK